MKGLREPVGDQPTEVYWRRRIVLLVALVVIVAVGWLILRAVTAGDPAQAADTGSTPAPTVTTSAQASSGGDGSATTDGATAQPAADASTDASPSPEPSDTAATISACGQSDLEVSLGGSPRVSADAVAFDVTVTQTGAEPCLLDSSTGKSALLVTSGDVRIWSSADCDATSTLSDKQWLLDAGKAKTFEVSWPRAWSSEGCGNPSSVPPQAGTYWAQLTFQGITADRIPFVLS
ncbi:hypothetical protein [Demequina soli]|uniref:hypothetical protein n=1 Tax=Demequina soli TaxID=1638987 RepID=UPI000785136F|nr:hypothetical protein [Demequina soli]